jgi:hypothetical protein
MPLPSPYEHNAALDALRESNWRRLLNIDDELAEIDDAEVRGIKDIDTAIETILGRLKRQRKQCERDYDNKARGLFLAEVPPKDTDQKEFCVDETALAEFKKHVKDCATIWTTQVIVDFDEEITTALRQILPALPTTPEPTRPPTNRATIHGKPPAQPLHLPTSGELILRFWGANKDTSVLPATLLGLGVFTVVTWKEDLSKMLAGIGTALMFPILYWLGRTVARKERDKLIREARDAHETAVLAFAKAECTEALQEHEEALTRWLHTRAAAWKKALKKRNDDAFFETTKKRFHDKRRELVLEKKRLDEKDRELQLRTSSSSA